MSNGRARALLRQARALAAGESGFALLAVLVLIAVGGLLLPPLLSLVATSLQLEEVHETASEEFYAADAGVEDALWQIKADELAALFPDYERYDYSTSYAYSDYPDTASAPALNGKGVDISVQNVWMPQGIDAPSSSEAQQIIDDGVLVVTGSATDADTFRIRITYNYQEVSDPDWEDLEIDEIGIWLPPGFSYVEESSNLEENPFDDYYCVPTTEAYKSGEAVVWSFSPNVAFTDMPDVDLYGYPLVTTITFDFASAGGSPPDAALSWVTVSGISDDVHYAWDADVRVFKVQSTATDPDYGTSTTVDAYTARGEIRHISAAIPGDYYATGNSLLTSTDSNDDYRNRLYKESSATVPTDDSGDDGIPTQGIPEAAYLYWTGWIDFHNYDPQPLFYDNCLDMSDWIPVDRWTLSSGRFRGRGSTTGADTRTLEKNPSLDLSACEPGTAVISWDQSESASNLSTTEGLFYAFSGDGGDTWSTNFTAFLNDNPPPSFSTVIPELYLTDDFRVRFYFNFNGTSEYVYIDNITISAGAASLEYPANPTTEALTALIEDAARTNVVLLEAGGAAAVEVTADSWEIEPTTGEDWEGTWSYCCYADVTGLVRQWIEDGDLSNNAGGTYTLGHKVAANQADPDYSFTLYDPSGPDPATGYPLGTPAPYPDDRSALRYQYSHAGWSLVVIYTSPDTQGHQLYLFDIQDPDFDFTEAWAPAGYPNPDFDGDGEGGGRIAGFLVPDPIEDETIAAKMTVFVGEGDSLISQDRAQLNGHSLSNSASPASNVWNSASPGMSVQGVDIDTFVVEWDDGILETGDTSADVDLPTQNDGFNLVYIILSFRSDVTSGGTISFLISG